MANNLAPVLLFCYNRPAHAQKTLAALQKNILADKTNLHIHVDGPRSDKESATVQEVIEICKNVTGFLSVSLTIQEKNRGLAKTIITEVSEKIEKYGRVIVLEDDLVTTPYFLQYMNEALNFYENNSKVFSIGGYNYPRMASALAKYPYGTYAGYRCCSWGWATWKDRWKLVDWDMKYYPEFSKDLAAQKIFDRSGPDMTHTLRLQAEKCLDSWAIRFCYGHFSNDKYCVYPVKSLSNNIGFDGSGTHCSTSDPVSQFINPVLDLSWIPKTFCPINRVDPILAQAFYSIFCAPQPLAASVLIPWYKKTILWKIAKKAKFHAKKYFRFLKSNI